MFTNTDFNVFNDPTLDGRMDKIRTIIDPKFEQFATKALEILKQDGDDWYAHVAKHRMRNKYAPDNTWVAFSTNKRGYKMLPHFELGFWQDHLYLYLAVESNMKPKQLDDIYPKLAAIQPLVAELPDHYFISRDHMVNQTVPISDYPDAIAGYQQYKSNEVLVGIKIDHTDPRLGTEQLETDLLKTLQTLIPLYEKLK
ncbi:DUF1054 family protein [Fructilactobacillus vespulae]|uniref:DUF1054 family protein n=1 Tax=Fructilactobacillus vespulae TaxID=1249630 RepID=UPI0039B4565C